MPTGCVYLATNTVNGTCYIGKSKSGLEARRKTHASYARNQAGGPFQKAMRKHGPDAFEWSVLFSSDDDVALLAAEISLIAQFKARGQRMYNMTDGGEGTAGRPISDATMAAMRAPMSEEQKEKLRASWTPERKAAQAEKMRNRKVTDETRQRSSKVQKGKAHSADTIAKIRASKSGKTLKPWSEERRAKTMATFAGKTADGFTRSEETKAKLSAAAKARFEEPGSRDHLRAAGLKGAAARWGKD